MNSKKNKRIKNNKGMTGLDINDLESVKSQKALKLILQKHKGKILAVVILVFMWVATTVVTWYMFFNS